MCELTRAAEPARYFDFATYALWRTARQRAYAPMGG